MKIVSEGANLSIVIHLIRTEFGSGWDLQSPPIESFQASREDTSVASKSEQKKAIGPGMTKWR